MNHAELIERLRTYRAYCPNTDRADHPICDQAATALDALMAERDAARAKALEEAAVIAETWFDHHRPQQPKKSRFDIYDIQHWAKAATKLVAEDIRALQQELVS